MKFHSSYFYPKFEWRHFDRSFFPIILILSGIGFLYFSMNTLVSNFGNIDPLPSIYMICFSFGLLLLGSWASPIGWTLINLNPQRIQVVPYKQLFKLILPLRSTYEFDKKTRIFIDATTKEMHLGVKGQDKKVPLDGMTDSSIRKFIKILKLIAAQNQNIKLEILKQVCSEKKLRFKPDEQTILSFSFEKDDRIKMYISGYTNEGFDIQMYERIKNGQFRDSHIPVNLERTPAGRIIFNWKIQNKGIHHLQIKNKYNDRENVIEFEIDSYHWINYSKRK